MLQNTFQPNNAEYEGNINYLPTNIKYLLGLTMSFQENKRGNWKEPKTAGDWQPFLQGQPTRSKGHITTPIISISEILNGKQSICQQSFFKQVA